MVLGPLSDLARSAQARLNARARRSVAETQALRAASTWSPGEPLPLEIAYPDEVFAHEALLVMGGLAWDTAEACGFHTDPATGEAKEIPFPESIALMHSELSEALECDRKGVEKDPKFPHLDARAVELADCLIRIVHCAQENGFIRDLAAAFIEKNRYNGRRRDHDPTERAKPGGKRY